MESILRDVIVSHFNDNHLYAECQHGFRKRRSCITQLLEVIEDLTQILDSKEPIDIVYLDFRKAFDTVPHERLLNKLQAYGIVGNVSRWIRQFLIGRCQSVHVGKEKSQKASVKSGIPQGSILGPILFTIFINDLPNCVLSTCKIFADDTKIFNTTDNHKILQNDLTNLQEWSDLWNLYFNIEKCKVLHIGNNNPCVDYTMKCKDTTFRLQECREEKDLGVTFDRTMLFDSHIQKSINKANQMIGLIKRTFCYLTSDIFVKLYKALVRPHLEYGNIIWYPHLKRQSSAIEKVQRRATRLLRECRGMSYTERLRYLNLHSLKGRRIRGDLIETYKLYNGLTDLEWSKFFSQSGYESTRRSDGKIFIQHCNTNTRKFVFSNRVATNWNNLPSNTKNAPTTNSFKNLLD